MSEFKAERAVFRAAMKQIGASIQKVLPGTFGAWGRFVVGKFRMHARQVLRVRSGDLSRSFTFLATGKGADTEGRFFSRSKYARLQEYGGTVRPKRAKALAIPVEGSPAMSPSGVSRYASPLRTTLPSTHSFWVYKNSNGAWLMGRKKDSKRAKARAWFALLKSVLVPPRLGFRREIKASIAQLREALAAGVNRVTHGR